MGEYIEVTMTSHSCSRGAEESKMAALSVLCLCLLPLLTQASSSLDLLWPQPLTPGLKLERYDLTFFPSNSPSTKLSLISEKHAKCLLYQMKNAYQPNSGQQLQWSSPEVISVGDSDYQEHKIVHADRLVSQHGTSVEHGKHVVVLCDFPVLLYVLESDSVMQVAPDYSTPLIVPGFPDKSLKTRLAVMTWQNNNTITLRPNSHHCSNTPLVRRTIDQGDVFIYESDCDLGGSLIYGTSHASAILLGQPDHVTHLLTLQVPPSLSKGRKVVVPGMEECDVRIINPIQSHIIVTLQQRAHNSHDVETKTLPIAGSDFIDVRDVTTDLVIASSDAVQVMQYFRSGHVASMLPGMEHCGKEHFTYVQHDHARHGVTYTLRMSTTHNPGHDQVRVENSFHNRTLNWAEVLKDTLWTASTTVQPGLFRVHTETTNFCLATRATLGNKVVYSITEFPPVEGKAAVTMKEAHVEANVGDAFVTLTCVTTEPERVRWYRVKGDNSMEELTHHLVSEGFHESTLMLTSPKVSDSGTYECRTVHSDWTSSAQTTLSVLDKSLSMTAHSQPPVRQGDPVFLRCDVTGGSDLLFTWLHQAEDGNVTLLDPQVYNIQSQNNWTALRLQKARLEDSGTYRCLANNQKKSASADILLEVCSPLAPVLQPGNKSVVAGESVSLQCEFSAHPSPRYQWLHRSPDSHVYSHVSGDVMEDGVSILHLHDVTPANHSGFYMCQASTPLESVNVTSAVMVLYAPVMKNLPENKTVEEGHAVNMSCLADASPTPSYVWFFQQYGGTAAEHATDVAGVRVAGELLRVDQAQPQHQGVYTCRASNEVGMTFGSVHLTVSTTSQTSTPRS